jgi:large subunit ribosomal protein L9
VTIRVTVNVARSAEEAERQARGERVGAQADEEAADAVDAAAMFESPETAEQPDV